MKILLDAQLPPALARWLCEQGFDAQCARDLGLREADDSVLWAHAQQTGSVILTKDEDFSLRAQQQSGGPVIVWLRLGNSSNTALRVWLEPRLPGIVQLIAQGSRLVEVV